MTFQIITIFPEILSSYFREGMISRALKNKAIEIRTHNLRDWSLDKHKSVDDRPYGGGAGMVMMAEPIIKALNDLTTKKIKRKIILLSAKGKTWDQAMAKKFSKEEEIILICGRYEGVDERIKKFIDQEISIGDYVLTGGELGAAIIIDSTARLLPGVLGNNESAKDESHSEKGILEYPQYTRPEILEIKNKKYKVPKVLLSGDHSKIKIWRDKNKKIKK